MTRRPALLPLAVLAVLLSPAAQAQNAPAPLAPPPPAPAPVTPALVPAEPFAGEIEAFEAADARKMPAKGGVLFIGSSSIRMWTDLARDFPHHRVINRGFGGSQIADSVRYATRIAIPYAPRTIVFYAGDNDLEAGRTPQQVLADFQRFAALVHAALPKTRILFVAIKPSIARWRLVDKIRTANGLVRDYARTDKRLGFVDIFPAMLGPDGLPRAELYREDGLHMTKAGYAIWRAKIAAALAK